MTHHIEDILDTHRHPKQRFTEFYEWLNDQGETKLAEKMVVSGITNSTDAINWFTTYYITDNHAGTEKAADIQEELTLVDPNQFYYGKPDMETGYIPIDIVPVNDITLTVIIDWTIIDYNKTHTNQLVETY